MHGLPAGPEAPCLPTPAFPMLNAYGVVCTSLHLLFLVQFTRNALKPSRTSKTPSVFMDQCLCSSPARSQPPPPRPDIPHPEKPVLVGLVFLTWQWTAPGLGDRTCSFHTPLSPAMPTHGDGCADRGVKYSVSLLYISEVLIPSK